MCFLFWFSCSKRLQKSLNSFFLRHFNNLYRVLFKNISLHFREIIFLLELWKAKSKWYSSNFKMQDLSIIVYLWSNIVLSSFILYNMTLIAGLFSIDFCDPDLLVLHLYNQGKKINRWAASGPGQYITRSQPSADEILNGRILWFSTQQY